jgi:LCP family protein required for cell wall assembly
MPRWGGEAPLHSPVVPEIAPPAPPPVYTPSDLRKKKGRTRATRRLIRLSITVGVTIVVLVAAVIAYYEYRNSQVKRVVVNGLAAIPPSGVENIVMVGSTSRCALKQQNPAFGLCSQGVTGVNSDVVMILHLDPARGTAAILSIPRDLFVPNARQSGPNKIDAALVEGPQQLVNAIQDDFGIPVQHYVELNFDSFAGVVDALGGVKMYFPEPVFDAYSGLNVRTAGCRQLDGFQALQVVRARHLQYKSPTTTGNNPRDWPQDPQSDLSRIRRDHEFLRVLGTAVSARGLSNPLTDNSIIGSVAPQLEVDSSFSLGSMLGLAITFHGVSPNATPQKTLPVVVLSSQNYVYGGVDYGNVELMSQPSDTQTVASFLGVGGTQDTVTGKALPAPSSVSVSVLNGTGITGQAGQTAGSLRALGYRVVGSGDARSQGSLAETMVTYSSSQNLGAAEQVLHSLSGAATLAKGPTADGAAVTVTTGSNFSVAAPAASAPAQGSSAPSRSASSSGSSSGAPLAAPTPQTQPLAPFDPRSCTASGGEGP